MRRKDGFIPKSKYYVKAFGLYIDAHDPNSCIARCVNDPLDSNLDNCKWKRIGNKLWIVPIPGVSIRKWDELCIAYDADYWYQLWPEWSLEI